MLNLWTIVVLWTVSAQGYLNIRGIVENVHFPRLTQLQSSEWWTNSNEIIINLKQDVQADDYSLFDAKYGTVPSKQDAMASKDTNLISLLTVLHSTIHLSHYSSHSFHPFLAYIVA
jgi:hypothetical protein